jgi:hypothetical protein
MITDWNSEMSGTAETVLEEEEVMVGVRWGGVNGDTALLSTAG